MITEKTNKGNDRKIHFVSSFDFNLKKRCQWKTLTKRCRAVLKVLFFSSVINKQLSNSQKLPHRLQHINTDCQRKTQTWFIFLLTNPEIRYFLLNSTQCEININTVFKRWCIWCEIFCSRGIVESKCFKDNTIKKIKMANLPLMLEEKIKVKIQHPDIHPKYNAGDQPTLDSPIQLHEVLAASHSFNNKLKSPFFKNDFPPT